MTHLKTLRIAAFGLIVSAFLHVLAPFVSGFSTLSLMMAGVAFLYVFFAWGTLREIRWLTYIVFCCLLIGSVGSYIASQVSSAAVPTWIFHAICVADLAVVSALFVYLWRPNPNRAAI